MIVCCMCETTRDGTRSEARADRWEPFAASSQWAIDSGPMVCPGCIDETLRSLIDAIKASGFGGRER